MKQRICWTFVIPCRKAKNAWVNILWLWSLDTINKGKNKYDSRPPTTFSNYISSYYFPYWKGTLGFDVLGMLYRMLLLMLLSHFSRVRLCATHPWDSPGKNTGVGCHFLLQCIKVNSESEVAQPCPTLRDPMDCSLPGSSVHGIFQARVLEWGAIAFSDTEC